jgi:hypothetical protein
VTKAELHDLIEALPEDSLDGAAILLHGLIDGPVDPAQAWFWTQAWRAGEQDADQELARGDGVIHNDTEGLITSLEAVDRKGSV